MSALTVARTRANSRWPPTRLLRIVRTSELTRVKRSSVRNDYDSPVIAVVIMVVVVPITIRMPAMLVFIPPSMVGIPAALTRFVQIVAPVLSLLALVAVMLNSFVKSVVGFRDASLAVVIGAQVRRAYEHE
jgi:hypothetical protein